jgi:hypothetical protein
MIAALISVDEFVMNCGDRELAVSSLEAQY